MVGINMDGLARDRVLKLMDEKNRIEGEIRDQTAVLESNNIDMQAPLVDADGYPRNDIDIYKVRHARHKIVCLQNDHKNIMKAIEKGLAEVHSNLLGSPEVASSQAPTTSLNAQINLQSNDGIGVGDSFAVVGFVDDGSPADLAGLCVNDEVVQFGSVNHSNFMDITQIHNVVAHSVGQNVTVVVKRKQHVLSLTVVPKPWSRPGLLGCHIYRKNSA